MNINQTGKKKNPVVFYLTVLPFIFFSFKLIIVTFLSFFLFLKKFYFYFILLYNTVLVLPYIDMNPPRVCFKFYI